jgi:hypothetical protein
LRLRADAIGTGSTASERETACASSILAGGIAL